MKDKIVIFLIFTLLISVTTTCFSNSAQSASGNTYYVSKTGSDSSLGMQSSPFRTIQKAANVVNPGDTVLVRGGTYSERVRMTRSGTSSAWITIKNYPGETPVIDGSGITFGGYGDGLVDLTSVAYVTIDGLTVRDSVHCGISAHESHDVTIKNCHTLYTAACGIRSDNNDLVPNPAYNIIVTYNWVQYSRQNPDQEAISFCRTRDFQITHNLIDDTNPYIGIDMKQGCYNGIVAYNEVDNVESGNIYIDCSGHNNHLSSYNIDIHHNYCHGADTGCKIGSEWDGDSVYDIDVYNNIFVNGVYNYKYTDVDTGDHSAFFDDICFYNNVFIAGTACLRLYVKPDGGEPHYYTNMVIRNNIFKAAEAISLYGQPESELTVDHNFFVTGTDSEVFGTSYLKGDPIWVNPSAGDYRQQSNSPAIDFGCSIDATSAIKQNTPTNTVTTQQNTATNTGTIKQNTPTNIGITKYSSSGTTATESKNNPPNKPTINGKINGKPDTEYEYKFVSTDPEGDNITYYINWGDDTKEVQIGQYQSGLEAPFIHLWSEKSNYIIKVKAIDVHDAESDWSTFKISIIDDPITQLIHRISERFPFLEKILNQYYN